MIKPTPNGPEQVAFSGKMIEIVHQPMDIGGKEVVFERARRAPGTRLIIPSQDGTKILLTKEHRHEINGFDYRLPGGKVFDSLTEYKSALEHAVDMEACALEAAKKELREETGLTSEDLTLIRISRAGATVEWDLYYFLVGSFTELSEGQALEAGEHITVTWVPKDEIMQLCQTGEMKEDRSIAVLLTYLATPA